MTTWRRHTQRAARNPFLPPGSRPVHEEATNTAQEPVVVSGPPAPVGAAAPERPVLRVPRDLPGRSAEDSGLLVQVVGLHGGAGASTVAGLLGDQARDCGVDLGRLVDGALPVLLVARTHAQGLDLVRVAAQQWSSHGLEPVVLLGVVVVADAPVLSAGLERGVLAVQRALPRCWRLDWCEDWRHDPDPPSPDALTRRTRLIRKNVLVAAANVAPARVGERS